MKPIQNEEDFRKYFTTEAMLEGYFVSFVEAHDTATGIPDLILARGDIVHFTELKFARNKRVKMRAQQKRWHRDMDKVGGISYIVVCDKGVMRLYRAIDVIDKGNNITDWHKGTPFILDGDVPLLLNALA